MRRRIGYATGLFDLSMRSKHGVVPAKAARRRPSRDDIVRGIRARRLVEACACPNLDISHYLGRSEQLRE